MKDFNVKVTNLIENKEAQELFFNLGASWLHGKQINENFPSDRDIILHNFGSQLFWAHTYETENFKDSEEITLQELRAMVVLNRVSLNDKIATAEVARQEEKHSHYKKDVSHLNVIDVYRVLELYGVESHAVGHAIKKLLCCGQRGAKGRKQDIQEAIDSLNRELEMVTEDEL
jgi:hypothetical protein